MNILLMLVPISVVLLGIAIGAFIWAVRSGQFDDLDTPSIDILAEHEPHPDPRDADTAPDSSGCDNDDAH